MYEGVINLFEAYEYVVVDKLWPKKKPARKEPIPKKLMKYEHVCCYCVICPVCFNDPSVSLAKSIIGCSGKTSNISQHVTGSHQDITFEDDKQDNQATL